MNEEKCPCCSNHCDVKNLSCGKGKEYFAKNTNKNENYRSHHLEKDESVMTLDERTIYIIQKCGHFLHHSEKIYSLNFLSNEEKQQLISILSKCLDNWKEI